MLFELLSEGVRDPGPEQRAALHARLTEAAATIGHRGLAAEYRRTLTQRFFEHFSRARRGAGPAAGGAAGKPARPVPAADGTRLERLRLLQAILLRHPELLHDVEAAWCRLVLPADLARVRAAVLEAAHDAASLDSGGLIAHLHTAGLAAQVDKMLASSPLPMSEVASPEAMPADAERGWWHFFGLLNTGGLDEEIDAAAAAFARDADEPSQRRLTMLVQTRWGLRRGEQADEED